MLPNRSDIQRGNHEHPVKTSDVRFAAVAHTGPGVAGMTFCSTPASCLDNILSGAFIGQPLVTAPGQQYDLGFWVRSFAGDSRISAFWDGVELLTTPTPNGPTCQYTLAGLPARANANANATYLEVHAYNSTDQHVSFDDFSMVRLNAAPPPVAPPAFLAISEPGIYGLMLAALGAIASVPRCRW